MSSATLARKHPEPIASLQRQMDRIRAGLSFRAADKLRKSLGVSMERLAQVLGMSRATLHRRKAQGRLGQDESERLVRYERILQKATAALGDENDATQWLNHPQRALGGAIPIDFASSEMGAREVESLLGRIEYGVYS
jgi:putative toxin-antitoxin system antitoxin component (TIGR02293 family)